MRIRSYQASDCSALAELFYETVHSINRKDYTENQIDAWASKEIDLDRWNLSFQAHETVVCIDGNGIVGFGDIAADGYLDRLYVHKDYQRKGVASMLCDVLESATEALTITTHASITAKGFFEKRGYRVISENQVVRKGVVLTNYTMKKRK